MHLTATYSVEKVGIGCKLQSVGILIDADNLISQANRLVAEMFRVGISAIRRSKNLTF